MKNPLKILLSALFVSSLTSAAEPAPPAPSNPAAEAINALGIDLLARATDASANALLSPYSIQNALAMTFAGADGDTHTEMAAALHYAADETALHRTLSDLRKSLETIASDSIEHSKESEKYGGHIDPIALTVANRLFGEQTFAFRAPFLDLLKSTYAAPLQKMDFLQKADPARREINTWVATQTRDRIKDLLPDGSVSPMTRLILVNAIYLKAPWRNEFNKHATAPAPFHFSTAKSADVPIMLRQDHFGYAKKDRYAAVTVPYYGNGIHLVLLIPDDIDGLAALEKSLKPADLAAARDLPWTDVILHLPKFKIQPPLMDLSAPLKALGMKTAFDEPAGSANFDKMAPRTPDNYLRISQVFHKTFLDLDEKGTEAAAATAVVMKAEAAPHTEKPRPIEVRVDRPFLFAIQHRETGACLFLGRVTDPR